jgi:hypothetical protein
MLVMSVFKRIQIQNIMKRGPDNAYIILNLTIKQKYSKGGNQNDDKGD